MVNLTGQSSDRWLLGYDIKINAHKAFNGYELT